MKKLTNSKIKRRSNIMGKGNTCVFGDYEGLFYQKEKRIPSLL